MFCPHRPICPGCPAAELTYADQLAEKQARLDAALAHFPHLPRAPRVRPAIRQEGYRHRLKLPVVNRGGNLAIGLTHPRTREVLDTPDCPVLEPRLREVLQKLLAALKGSRGLHSIDLRISAATGAVQAVLAVGGGDLAGGSRAARALVRNIPELRSLAVSRADPKRRRVMGTKPRVLAGSQAIEERIGETSYQLLPGSFFQVDPANADQLHAIVRDFVGDAPRVLDLYAGVGAYARMLAPGRERVVAVEEVPQAAAAARRDAPPSLQVIASRVEHLSDLDGFDVAILNPARRGSDPETLARLGRSVDQLVYVSCGPETLARDLDILAAHGLRVDGIEAVDLFPQTYEVETVVSLRRKRPLKRWKIPGGEAIGPWRGRPSGALGRHRSAIALVLGKTPPHGRLKTGSFERLGVVATHSLLRITVNDRIDRALSELARRGHRTAWRDERTRAFFVSKAGLVRPFVHIEEAKGKAPLHGDLVLALRALGAPDSLLRKVGVRN